MGGRRVQIVVATITALLVYAIGARVMSRRAGTIAAVLATLNPYLVWHDVHLNREVLDQLVAAVLILCTLIAADRRSTAWAIAAGVFAGLAILGNVAADPHPGRRRRLPAFVRAAAEIGSRLWL